MFHQCLALSQRICNGGLDRIPLLHQGLTLGSKGRQLSLILCQTGFQSGNEVFVQIGQQPCQGQLSLSSPDIPFQGYNLAIQRSDLLIQGIQLGILLGNGGCNGIDLSIQILYPLGSLSHLLGGLLPLRLSLLLGGIQRTIQSIFHSVVLSQALFIFLFTGFQLLLGLIKLTFGGCQLFFAVHELLLCFSQLFLQFQLTLFILTQAIFILGQALVIGILSLLTIVFHSFLGQRLHQGLQGICRSGSSILIFLAIYRIFSFQGNMDFRQIIQLKNFRQYIEAVCQGSISHCRTAPVQIHIQRRIEKAYHSKLPASHAVQRCFFIGQQNLHLSTQDLFGHMVAIQKAFIGVFRHTAGHQSKCIEFLWHSIKPIDRRIFLSQLSHQIQIDKSLCLIHRVHLGNFLHILRIPAIGTHQPQVKHIMFVHKPLSSGDHVRLGHQQTNEHAGAQGDNCHNGKVPS